MKKLLLLLTCLTLASAPVMLTTGCKMTYQQVTYKSLKSIQTASVTGLKLYGAAYRAGKIDADKRERILVAYTKYQTAFALAIEAAKFDFSAPASADLTNLCNELLLTINIFTK